LVATADIKNDSLPASWHAQPKCTEAFSIHLFLPAQRGVEA
jgi:hypothetical protein